MLRVHDEGLDWSEQKIGGITDCGRRPHPLPEMPWGRCMWIRKNAVPLPVELILSRYRPDDADPCRERGALTRKPRHHWTADRGNLGHHGATKSSGGLMAGARCRFRLPSTRSADFCAWKNWRNNSRSVVISMDAAAMSSAVLTRSAGAALRSPPSGGRRGLRCTSCPRWLPSSRWQPAGMLGSLRARDRSGRRLRRGPAKVRVPGTDIQRAEARKTEKRPVR